MPIAPLSQDTEVLYGDPDAAGEPFVMRIRELPGTIIPPHKHPVDEHLTVVQGTLYFAVADQFDLAALKEIKAGGYAFIPKGRTMFGYIPDGAIVQGTVHVGDRQQATIELMFAHLDDQNFQGVEQFEPSEMLRWMRLLGLYDVGKDEQGQPLQPPERMLEAERRVLARTA